METRKIDPSVVLFIDFDGTATRTPGRLLVSTEYFTSFFQAPSSGLLEDESLYSRGIFKSKDNAIQIIKDNLFAYNRIRDKRRLTPEFVNFLKNMQETKNVSIFFVSLNRGDYIETMLELEGISFKNVGICSSLDGFAGYTADPRFERKLNQKLNGQACNKFDAVNFHLETLIEIAKEDYPDKYQEKLQQCNFKVFDDSSDDIYAMAAAINQNKYDQYSFYQHYNIYRRDPGNFAWGEYQNHIIDQLNPKPVVEMDVVVTNNANLSFTNTSVGLYSTVINISTDNDNQENKDTKSDLKFNN